MTRKFSMVARDQHSSVIVTRYSDRLRDALVLHRIFQHRAGLELADGRALHFLPGRLARRNGVATLGLQRTPPRVQLLLGNEHVGLAASQIDPNPVAAA